jgi:hypothetical protein
MFLSDSFLFWWYRGPWYDTCGGAGNFMTAFSSEVFAAFVYWLVVLVERYSAVRHFATNLFGIPGWPARPIEQSKPFFSNSSPAVCPRSTVIVVRSANAQAPRS